MNSLKKITPKAGTIGAVIAKLVAKHNNTNGIFILQEALLQVTQGAVLRIDGGSAFDSVGYKEAQERDYKAFEACGYTVDRETGKIFPKT